MSTAPDPQNLLDAIHHRRSFKPNMLKPDPVPRAVLESVLEAAQWALNHGRTQPWHYIVFTGESRKTLGEAFAHAYQLEADKAGKFVQATLDSQHKKVLDAPVWIAIALKPALRPDGSPAMPIEEEIMAVACSVQLLHLAASAFGLGGQWTTSPTGLHHHTAAFCGLQPPARLLGFFYLGYPAIPWPEGKRHALPDHITWRE
jgi:nitroreductase